MRQVKLPLVLALLLFLSATVALGQTGKIAGMVTDPSGEPLPGVNVVIDGTTQGAVTDGDGFYTILNVRPGTYDLRASFIGFAPQVKEGVRVNIDLTTEVDFEMREEAVGLGEIIVAAQRPIVQRDISANVANLSAEEMVQLPVAGVEEVIDLQAGIEPGLRVRGGGQDQLAVIVDGLSMRDGRDNTPFTGISYTAVEEVQVQTGGFNAEYGNVRSGLINIVTKEGARDRYNVDVLTRYSPPHRKYFGPLPSDATSYYMRPYLDPAVADIGTHSAESPWDVYERDQYPKFEGWNTIAEQLTKDDDPSNDMTVDQLKELFQWRHRKSFEITAPDYQVDGSVGGPVPGISHYLGDLRFLASFRQTQSSYAVPQMRDAYQDRTVQLKLTSNIATGMKLVLQGLYGKQFGINASSAGFPAMFRGDVPAYPWDNSRPYLATRTGRRDVLYTWHYLEPQDVTRSLLGATFTHTLNAKTFYEVQLQRTGSAYYVNHGEPRDTSMVKMIGNMRVDEAPWGWVFPPTEDEGQLDLGGHWGEARDSSETAVWSGRFDITSQVNRYAQVKAGLEYIYSNYDTQHGEVGFWRSIAYPTYSWERQPTQGAAYAQSKLEFKGMVANLGLRLDYFHAGGEWFDYGQYSRAFSASYGFDEEEIAELEDIQTVQIERQVSLSPRLGVSFPITENSKLYFNYGHFRQMLDPNDIFVIRTITSGAVDWIGNPNHPMPRTVAYELGYEQNLFNQFLLRLTGYYKALDRQPRLVGFTSVDDVVDYSLSLPNNYADIRGFEVSLQKNRGKWFRGFANFTYMASKRGNFGLAEYYESSARQRLYLRSRDDHYQSKPIPEPYARVNLEFIAPEEFGPKVAGINPLGGWHLNLLGNWRAGEVFTWSGGAPVAGLRSNIRWKDYYMFDLRLSKNFDTSVGRAMFFADVENVFNIKHLHQFAGFQGDRDFEKYMYSLHLPEATFEDVDTPPYEFIRGNDRPGAVRKPGAAFVPIEIGALPETGRTRPLYYVPDESRYYRWNDEAGAFEQADRDFVDQVMEDKAYIDMPNQEYFSFFNPRNIIFGLRLSF